MDMFELEIEMTSWLWQIFTVIWGN